MALTVSSFVACGISADVHDAVVAEKEAAQASVARLEEEKEVAKASVARLVKEKEVAKTSVVQLEEEQNRIAERLNGSEKIKNTNSESDKKIEELKSSLL
jgi:hypothetical protein